MDLSASYRRKVANAKYRAKHPNASTLYRHAKLAEQGKEPKSVGRQVKRKGGTFNCNLRDQNLNVITKNNLAYELQVDEGVDEEFRLRRSRAHGFGLYSAGTVDLPVGAVLMSYRGEIISQNEANIREARYRAEGIDNYMFDIESGGNVIDATKKGNLARFINHCCEPNCESVSTENGDGILIVAIAEIKYASEITIDYKLKPGPRIPCTCRAKNCRKSL